MHGQLTPALYVALRTLILLLTLAHLFLLVSNFRLRLAEVFLKVAFHFAKGVSGNFARDFLYCTFDLFAHTTGLILVHVTPPGGYAEVKRFVTAKVSKIRWRTEVVRRSDQQVRRPHE